MVPTCDTLGLPNVRRSPSFMGKVVIFALACSVVVFGQANSGELRLKLTDPSGLAVRAPIHIISKANQYHRILTTDDQGALTVQRLPYGMYQLQINLPGFAGVSESVGIHSSIPIEHWVQLKIVAQSESVTVSAANTLIDPGQPGSVGQVGTEPIQNRASSIPGRSIQDLVNSQPGWLYEGNAVLHPRGSEYQTQFVVDGIPLTDNRSPSFGPQIEADDVQSLSIYRLEFQPNTDEKWAGLSRSIHYETRNPAFAESLYFPAGASI